MNQTCPVHPSKGAARGRVTCMGGFWYGICRYMPSRDRYMQMQSRNLRGTRNVKEGFCLVRSIAIVHEDQRRTFWKRSKDSKMMSRPRPVPQPSVASSSPSRGYTTTTTYKLLCLLTTPRGFVCSPYAT